MYAILTYRMVPPARPGRYGRAAAGLMLAVALALSAACGVKGPQAEPERIEVTLGGVRVLAEIADDPTERGRGLQEHGPLAPGEGMLFVFDDAAPRTFAMKDVTFPIDVLFIAGDLTVSAVEPLDPGDERLVTSPGPSPYVIELPQGWAAEQGIGVGSVLVVP